MLSEHFALCFKGTVTSGQIQGSPHRSFSPSLCLFACSETQGCSLMGSSLDENFLPVFGLFRSESDSEPLCVYAADTSVGSLVFLRSKIFASLPTRINYSFQQLIWTPLTSWHPWGHFRYSNYLWDLSVFWNG
ncbi:hypothetical protein XENORESO_001437 [Xenotaenia resolanae]|uniref:Uncharacterized protein n=1 Tax=Xenotaenia resolanae TaxID=208358 RepID=A0ABV0VU14_9TELE